VQTRRPALILWLIPMCLYSADALAWGLATHVYFAQLLVWAVPLADPLFRRAARRFPHLILAGSCLPDLSLVGGAPFRLSHRWENWRQLLGSAKTDEERALTVGYASHLLADVVAHNHFVPAHEALWLDWPVVTHAMGEWAMDAHVAPHLFAAPGPLLRAHRQVLAAFVSARFHCPRPVAERGIARLAAADLGLRRSRVPEGLYRLFTAVDRRVSPHFDYYVAETATRFARINGLLAGETPVCPAEPEWGSPAWKDVQMQSLDQLLAGLPLPQSLFAGTGLSRPGVLPSNMKL
jgi:hypothetical protein